MPYKIPIILNSNSEPRCPCTLGTSVGEVLIIFSNSVKFETFVKRVSRAAASKGYGVGYLAKEHSSFDEVVRDLIKIDSSLADVTFLSDSDQTADELIASLSTGVDYGGRW
jgi:hypothetical protein